MKPRTKDNLNTAMEAAALAIAKYSRFAAGARSDEDWELAREFQQTADSERCEHFARESDLAGLIEESADNLRNTIAAETKEVELCKRFAREAQEDGDARQPLPSSGLAGTRIGDASDFSTFSKGERPINSPPEWRFSAMIAEVSTETASSESKTKFAERATPVSLSALGPVRFTVRRQPPSAAKLAQMDAYCRTTLYKGSLASRLQLPAELNKRDTLQRQWKCKLR